MTKADLSQLSTQELVSIYTGLSVKQSEALELDNTPLAKALFKEMIAVDALIRGRGVEARRMLVPLLDHKNAQVRINAAKALLAVVPERARATLGALASDAPSIQRLDARMCLNHLGKGIFKPT